MLNQLPQTVPVFLVLVVVSVAILWKSADWFVEGAVGIAYRLHVPPMLVGIVLVSLATTAPELMASLLAALRGMPEVALGNAVGSVLVDASVALGLAAVVARRPLEAHPRVFRTSATFLLLVIGLSFLMTLNGTLGRAEGLVLVGLFVVYTAYTYRENRRHPESAPVDTEALAAEAAMPVRRILLLFGAGAVGVYFGSSFLIHGATGLASVFQVPDVIAGLTVVAVGTSTPEIATVVASARRGESSVGVGNVIGADILNICWVAGVSAAANPLTAQKSVIWLMFPAMVIVVVTMLLMLRRKYQLGRRNGAVLLSLYATYAVVLVALVATGVIKPPPIH
ncbi:MAG: calcium/sodium antiporter [Anaerolineae bacterium]|nr:calcium/sodium antiporter [Anaerolineae bacterium]